MKSELRIEGMHCHSCAEDIRETLEATAGVLRAAVTFDGKTASVEYDGDVVQPQTLIKTIQDLGHQATVGDASQANQRSYA